MADGYWGKYWRRRVSRRGVLAGGAATAAGAAALVAVGCGDDDGDDAAGGGGDDNGGGADPTATPAPQQTDPDETATPAPTEAPSGPITGGTFKSQRDLADTGYDPGIIITGHLWTALTYNHLLGYSLVEDEAWGDAAASWEQPDPLTLVFNLEPNLRFNPEAANGRQITSQDIAYSFGRLPDAYVNQASQVNPLQYAWMRGFDTPDDTTLNISMLFPWVSAIPTLGSASLAIVAPEMVEANGGNLLQTVNAGGGAYMFETQGLEGTNTYMRNPNYAGHSTARGRFTKDPPYIDRWEEAFVPDGTTREARFLAGDADVLSSVVAGLDVVQAEQLRESDGVRILEGPSNTHLVLALDAFKWAAHPLLREALALSIDWDGYIDIVLDGNGIRGAPVGPLFPQVLSQEEIRQLQQYDPARARQLWEQGGGDEVFPDGFTTISPTFASIRGLEFFTQSIQESIGVPTRLEPADLAQYVSHITAPPGTKLWDFFTIIENAISTIPDYNALTHYVPEGFGGTFGLFTFQHSRAGGVPDEIIAVTDGIGQPVQDLYNLQLITPDPEARTEVLQRLQRLLFTQFCCAFPMPVPSVEYHAVRDRVQGVPPVPDFADNGSMSFRRTQTMWLSDA